MLRTRQKDAIITMLNLNNKEAVTMQKGKKAQEDASFVPQAAVLTDPVWKVLIYDQAGQEIISPLLKVNELRENGITVHMHLSSDRQTIPDVPAIYFVQPTAENIKRIGEDLSRSLYETYFFNFSYMLPRAFLEDLASASISANASSQVAQVYDQYLNFICLEERLFNLNFTDSYKVLHDSGTSDMAINQLTDRIVNSLLSVFATLGIVPIIRAQPGNAAQSVATKLDSRFRDHTMNARHNLFATSLGTPASQRPLLVLLDRDLDLSAMLAHSWTYSALVHDILDMKLNRVVVPIEEGNVKTKSYDVDVSDFFWAKNAGNPFPQVAGDVSAEMNRYKKDVEEVTRSSGVASLDELDPTSNAKSLKNALTVLPELTERRRTMDMHMNIATALFKVIGDRQIDTFTAAEESILKQTKATMTEILNDEKKAEEDKIRLFLIYYLSTEVSKEDMAHYEAVFEKNKISLRAVNYVKGVRSFMKLMSASTAPQQTSSSQDIFQSITSNISKFAGQLDTSRVVGGGFENLLSGVANLVGGKRDLPIIRIVDSLMEGSLSQETEDFITFDPRQAKAATPKAAKGRLTYSEAVVFTVGGGNYVEYQNLQEYAQRSAAQKKIIYGSTEMLTAKAFLTQLEKLSEK